MDAEERLIKFTEATYARYQAAPHHHLIAKHLERVERGEVDRLMLLVPPRHGKSELASRKFPGCFLGRQPHKHFISVSATLDLAKDFGRDVRNLLDSPEYRAIFNTRLAEDSYDKANGTPTKEERIMRWASVAQFWVAVAMLSLSMILMAAWKMLFPRIHERLFGTGTRTD
jgi:hypothetical protein